MKSPLLRFYCALVITILLLVLSMGQLYDWLSHGQNPQIDARRVLDAVQQLTYKQEPLRCAVQDEADCSQALFIEYPAGSWGSADTDGKDSVITLSDSQGHQLLCGIEPKGELLCINQLNWPSQAELTLDLAYLFYFLLFLALFLFSRSLFRDIELLRHSALQEIRFGKFPAFTLSPRSYLQPLAQSLHSLSERLEQLNRFQAEMAETVCHDIKTPLARLKFISHMLDKERLVEAQQHISRNLDEIEENVYDYLRLAQNEYSQQVLQLETIEMLPYVNALLVPFVMDTDKQIHNLLSKNITLQADRKLLARAINNLLLNALRFSRHQIWVRLEVEADWLLLSVEDDGNGWGDEVTMEQPSSPRGQDIGVATASDPATELAHSTHREGLGSDSIPVHHGIGLAIVRRVMQQHGGYLALTQAKGGGALAVLHLPLTPQA